MEQVNYHDTEVGARAQAFNVTKLNDNNHFKYRLYRIVFKDGFLDGDKR